MGHFRSFMLGVAVAFGVYYITRKDRYGKSLLDDVLDDPAGFANQAKDYAVNEAVKTVKQTINNL